MTSNSGKFEGGHKVGALEKIRTNADIEISRQDNQSRKIIAYWFTAAFIMLDAAIIIFAPIYNATLGVNSPLDISDLLAKFNGFFGTPLGFVLGYYFKK